MQGHLAALMGRQREGFALLGVDVSKVHWQSVAVILTHASKSGTYAMSREVLKEPTGWFRDGLSGTYRPSLYLSPKGMPYFVEYGGHSHLYHQIFQVSQDLMDRAGWLHISDGRVDVACRMTAAQSRWLEANRPERGEWRIEEVYSNALSKPPEPYDRVAPFDVRPMLQLDWARFERSMAPREALAQSTINNRPSNTEIYL